MRIDGLRAFVIDVLRAAPQPGIDEDPLADKGTPFGRRARAEVTWCRCPIVNPY